MKANIKEGKINKVNKEIIIENKEKMNKKIIGEIKRMMIGEIKEDNTKELIKDKIRNKMRKRDNLIMIEENINKIKIEEITINLLG